MRDWQLDPQWAHTVALVARAVEIYPLRTAATTCAASAAKAAAAIDGDDLPQTLACHFPGVTSWCYVPHALVTAKM